jgi:hypothetical protein
MKENLARLADYSDKCWAEEAHLLIFYRNPSVKWEEKTFTPEKEYKGVKITVWGGVNL